MGKFAAASVAVVFLATTPVFAADLFTSAPPPLDDPQTELGSNWYIRGDVGYGVANEPTVVPTAGLLPPTQQSYFGPGLSIPGLTFNDAPIGDAANNVPVVRGNNRNIWTTNFDAGLGYRVNDYVRVEALYNYAPGPGLSTAKTVICPGSVTAVSNYYPQTAADGTVSYTAVPYGYAYPGTTCNGYLNAHQYNNTALANAYVDIGTWWGITPYVGAGFGANVNTIKGTLNYFNTADGSRYTGVSTNGTAPAIWVQQTGIDAVGHPIYTYVQNKNGAGPQVIFGPLSWNRTINATKYTFAADLMAGVGVKISQSATLDIGYRYLNLAVGSPNKATEQSVKIGVRYNLN